MKQIHLQCLYGGFQLHSQTSCFVALQLIHIITPLPDLLQVDSVHLAAVGFDEVKGLKHIPQSSCEEHPCDTTVQEGPHRAI